MFENSMQMPSTIILIDKHTLFQFINAAQKQRGIENIPWQHEQRTRINRKSHY